jgi:hypothetical protein
MMPCKLEESELVDMQHLQGIVIGDIYDIGARSVFVRPGGGIGTEGRRGL